MVVTKRRIISWNHAIAQEAAAQSTEMAQEAAM